MKNESILKMIEEKYIRVAAGVICNADNNVLLTTRKVADGSVLWEFPGGKIEPGESAAIAAARELREELNLKIYPADTMYITVYKYPDKVVELNFVRCFCFDFSEIEMLDNQEFKWADVRRVAPESLLAADRDFLKFLQMRAINS